MCDGGEGGNIKGSLGGGGGGGGGGSGRSCADRGRGSSEGKRRGERKETTVLAEERPEAPEVRSPQQKEAAVAAVAVRVALAAATVHLRI